ncbi:MAG: cytochrome c biogenesis protein DipZ [Candidatus Gottesmanbacteria bacterium]|nr:cytochrome c biogenesis protein DipZ [Candidatus Gottesmanbacteria bacterium]
MILLVAFAFLGGIVTILSPCILPILPIVLSGSITGGKQRPWGVVVGFIASFTFFTLFLSAIVKATNISADALRMVSVVVIAIFGLSLLLPMIQLMTERLFSRLTGLLSPRTLSPSRSDFFSGLLVGLSLGLLWTPCVGPILASIITLAATSQVTADTIIITLAYATGTAIPLLAITYGGRSLLTKNPWLVANSGRIQKGFGILMILTALSLYLQLDRRFQSYILNRFPNYGLGLTKFEDTALIKKSLQQLQNPSLRKESSMINAPELIPGGIWFNLPANQESMSIKSLRGQVVLVDFWTYTCINCIRTLPYLKSWHEKYKNKGLTIVGIHTPEFEFEKNPDNVARAIRDFGIMYPVMQDNAFATWNAYANRYWPAKYLIDKNGVILYTHFGEGNYDETETKIQELLKEAGTLTEEMPVNNAAYQTSARTPETYLGNWRIAAIASPERIQQDVSKRYSIPENLTQNTFALGGTWMVGYEYAQPERGANLIYRFDAANVFLVMRPKTKGTIGTIRVLLDGKPADKNTAGEDVNDGVVRVDADRLYKLIKLPSGGEHTLELEFPEGNIELYAFTFG